MPYASAWPDVRPIVPNFRSRVDPSFFPPLPRFSWFRSKAAATTAEGMRAREGRCPFSWKIFIVSVRHARRTKGSKTAFLQILRSFLPESPRIYARAATFTNAGIDFITRIRTHKSAIYSIGVLSAASFSLRDLILKLLALYCAKQLIIRQK